MGVAPAKALAFDFQNATGSIGPQQVQRRFAYQGHVFGGLRVAQPVVLPKSWTVSGGYLSQRHEPQTYPSPLYC
jgi:hypothetical protein